MLIEGDENPNTLSGGAEDDTIRGNGGDDTLSGGAGNDDISGGDGNDAIAGDAGNDALAGGAGNDVMTGGAGADFVQYDFDTDGADTVDLGAGDDSVIFSQAPNGVRLTLDGAAVGNGLGNAADGLPAVSVQALDSDGALSGPLSRYDDEGIAFAKFIFSPFTFSVEDGRGETDRQYDLVRLGSHRNDTFAAMPVTTPFGFSPVLSYYVRGGLGADSLTTLGGDDSLFGDAGADRLVGGAGNDRLVGGEGNDRILGEAGDDIVDHNVSTDGADQVLLGLGWDTVNLSADADVRMIRLSFDPSGVGNRSSYNSGTFAVAARVIDPQGGFPTGATSVFDDEGVRFVSTRADLKLDVFAGRRMSVDVAILGTPGNDVISEAAETRQLYINGGAGADGVTGGSGADYLSGGDGNDKLNGGAGDDTFEAFGAEAAGADRMVGGAGNDSFLWNTATGGSDQILGGLGQDGLRVFEPSTDNISVYFEPEDVGNRSSYRASGGLAVQLLGSTKDVLTMDDEGFNLSSTDSSMFDLFDVSTSQLIGTFSKVKFGTHESEYLTINEAGFYVNVGAGDDVVIIGTAGFVAGGAGNDTLSANQNDITLYGGPGADRLSGVAQRDIFRYESLTDSLVDPAGQDIISGPSFGNPFNTSKIDLSRLPFYQFTGSQFTGAAGDVISVGARGSWLVQGDVDGDRVADFAITVISDLSPGANDFMFTPWAG